MMNCNDPYDYQMWRQHPFFFLVSWISPLTILSSLRRLVLGLGSFSPYQNYPLISCLLSHRKHHLQTLRFQHETESRPGGEDVT